MALTNEQYQLLIPGWGFVTLPQTTKNDVFIPGMGLVCDFNNYQAPNNTPFFIGYPT